MAVVRQALQAGVPQPARRDRRLRRARPATSSRTSSTCSSRRWPSGWPSRRITVQVTEAARGVAGRAPATTRRTAPGRCAVWCRARSATRSPGVLIGGEVVDGGTVLVDLDGAGESLTLKPVSAGSARPVAPWWCMVPMSGHERAEGPARPRQVTMAVVIAVVGELVLRRRALRHARDGCAPRTSGTAFDECLVGRRPAARWASTRAQVVDVLRVLAFVSGALAAPSRWSSPSSSCSATARRGSGSRSSLPCSCAHRAGWPVCCRSSWRVAAVLLWSRPVQGLVRRTRPGARRQRATARPAAAAAVDRRGAGATAPIREPADPTGPPEPGRPAAAAGGEPPGAAAPRAAAVRPSCGQSSGPDLPAAGVPPRLPASPGPGRSTRRCRTVIPTSGR